MSNIWSDSFSTIREPFFEEKKEEDEVLKKKSKKNKDDADDDDDDADDDDTADKDYDGDGKLESGKEEYFGSKDKAIKKAMNKEERQLHSSAGKNDKVDTKKGIRNIINTKPTVSEEVDAWIKELLDEGYDLSEFTIESIFEVYQNLKLEESDTYGMSPMGDAEKQKADPMSVAKAKAAKAKVTKERADVLVAQQAQRLKVDSAESVSFYVSNRFSIFEEVCNSKKSKVKVANSILKSLKDK